MSREGLPPDLVAQGAASGGVDPDRSRDPPAIPDLRCLDLLGDTDDLDESEPSGLSSTDDPTLAAGPVLGTDQPTLNGRARGGPLDGGEAGLCHQSLPATASAPTIDLSPYTHEAGLPEHVTPANAETMELSTDPCGKSSREVAAEAPTMVFPQPESPTHDPETVKLEQSEEGIFDQGGVMDENGLYPREIGILFPRIETEHFEADDSPTPTGLDAVDGVEDGERADAVP